jgi:hypothetical protein
VEDREDREKRERRAEDLRRAIQRHSGGDAGERPRPRSPHEFVEERMREESERREREAEDEDR